ncbi:hypothetical protein [Streptomyces sp. NPDC013187]|uniref:hypothetical protein n=1 Tax=Streptomyces sp. NPDC013187 TaxID=3364865 RepID=UPI0036888FDB
MKMTQIRSRGVLGRVATAVAAAMCAVMLTATHAAAGAADLSRTLYMTRFPEAGNGADMSRTIYLAAGTYHWNVGLEGAYAPVDSGYVERKIYLAAGTYTWNCRVYAPDNYVYQNTCSLEKPGSERAWIESPLYDLYTSSTYTLNSRLLQL